MPTYNMIQAVNDALRLEMRRDKDVVVLGEDVGKFGGVFRATQGLYEEFGGDRVIDTPLAEGGIIGTALGMALYGLRPVPEIQFADFIFPAMDQIVNELSKYRYRSGGQFSCPLVIRSPYGGGIRGGHYHSQSPEAHFIHTAGIKVVVPATPEDAKGLLASAIRDPDPVLFLEPKRVYRAAKGEVPEGEYALPLGQAKVTRAGHQVTVLAWGAMWHEADQAAREAEQEGIDCDLRLPGCIELKHVDGPSLWRDGDHGLRVAGRVAGGTIDPGALIAQGKPWMVSPDAAGRKRLKRAFIA